MRRRRLTRRRLLSELADHGFDDRPPGDELPAGDHGLARAKEIGNREAALREAVEHRDVQGVQQKVESETNPGGPNAKTDAARRLFAEEVRGSADLDAFRDLSCGHEPSDVEQAF